MPGSLYGFVWAASARSQLVLVAISTAVFLLTLAPLELQRRIVDGALGDADRNRFLLLCGMYAAVVLVQGVLKLAMNLLRGRVAERAVRELRALVGVNASKPICHSVDDSGGSVVSMVAAEVEHIGGFVGESVSVPVLQVGILVSVFGYMLWVNPVLAGVAIGLFAPQAYLVPRVQAAINRRGKHRIAAVREAGDAILDFEEGQDESYRKAVREAYRLRLTMNRLKFTLKFVLNLLHHFAAIGVLFFGGLAVIEGRIGVGTVVAFLSGLHQIETPWRELVAFFRQASAMRVSYAMFREVLSR